MRRPAAVFGSIVAASIIAASIVPILHARRVEVIVTTGEIIVRERADSVSSIGMSVIDKLPTSRNFDQLLATLPTDRQLTPGSLPDGWTAVQKGRQITASGPAQPEVNLRFDFKGNNLDDYVGKDATIQSGLGKRLDQPVKIKIQLQPRVEVTPFLDGILTPPAQATPGQPFLIGVGDLYRRGTWQLGTTEGGPVPLLPLEAIRDMSVFKSGTPRALYDMRGTDGFTGLLSRPAPRPFITAYPAMGRFTSARFIDRFGDRLVDAPLTIDPGSPGGGGRRLTGGSAFAFAGQAACVSGQFPTFGDPYGLVLDGRTVLVPWGASQTTVMLGIPDGTTAGPHTISDPNGSSSITVGILTVEGTIDQNKLWKGESTTMRLRVVGTDQKLPVGVLNRTPSIIDIDGGVRQTLTSAGGQDNVITRGVTGIHRGDFSNLYSVSTAGCGR
jgi:hypothetical protein